MPEYFVCGDDAHIATVVYRVNSSTKLFGQVAIRSRIPGSGVAHRPRLCRGCAGGTRERAEGVADIDGGSARVQHGVTVLFGARCYVLLMYRSDMFVQAIVSAFAYRDAPPTQCLHPYLLLFVHSHPSPCLAQCIDSEKSSFLII